MKKNEETKAMPPGSQGPPNYLKRGLDIRPAVISSIFECSFACSVKMRTAA
jgi:hypothetical protein